MRSTEPREATHEAVATAGGQRSLVRLAKEKNIFNYSQSSISRLLNTSYNYASVYNNTHRDVHVASQEDYLIDAYGNYDLESALNINKMREYMSARAFNPEDNLICIKEFQFAKALIERSPVNKMQEIAKIIAFSILAQNRLVDFNDRIKFARYAINGIMRILEFNIKNGCIEITPVEDMINLKYNDLSVDGYICPVGSYQCILLHLGDSASYLLGEREKWAEMIYDNELFGVFVQQSRARKHPVFALNASEAAWVIGEKNLARNLLQIAFRYEPKLKEVVRARWGKTLEADFVGFILES